MHHQSKSLREAKRYAHARLVPEIHHKAPSYYLKTKVRKMPGIPMSLIGDDCLSDLEMSIEHRLFCLYRRYIMVISYERGRQLFHLDTAYLLGMMPVTDKLMIEKFEEKECLLNEREPLLRLRPYHSILCHGLRVSRWSGRVE